MIRARKCLTTTFESLGGGIRTAADTHWSCLVRYAERITQQLWIISQGGYNKIQFGRFLDSSTARKEEATETSFHAVSVEGKEQRSIRPNTCNFRPRRRVIALSIWLGSKFFTIGWNIKQEHATPLLLSWWFSQQANGQSYRGWTYKWISTASGIKFNVSSKEVWSPVSQECNR